jgi:hypothetical protein
LDRFEQTWEKAYPIIARSWRSILDQGYSDVFKLEEYLKKMDNADS